MRPSSDSVTAAVPASVSSRSTVMPATANPRSVHSVSTERSTPRPSA